MNFAKAITTFACFAICLTASAAEPSTNWGEFFELKVRPILADKCYSCHGQTDQQSELRLDTAERFFKGGTRGPIFNRDNPLKSAIIRTVLREDDLKMPPDDPLKPEEIAVLKEWVANGAIWPKQSSPSKNGSDHWAFQPIKPPVIAKLNDSWCVNDLDRYVLGEMKKHGIEPAPRADRPVLLRRLFNALVGLPPSIEEIDQYLNDPETDRKATENLIERLLSSLHYGERWGRHWLDVARFTDTPGFSSTDIGLGNMEYHDAFTYRDYVIESLNQDLPFDKFVKEQLAADLIPETRNDIMKLRALGFLTCGRRDKRDLHEIYDDQIDTVSRGFMGMTVQCARCHDHKFDDIPTDDYYSLYGIFASVYEPSYPELPVSNTSEGKEYEVKRNELNAKLNSIYDKRANEANKQFISKLPKLIELFALMDRDARLDIRKIAFESKLPESELIAYYSRWRSSMRSENNLHLSRAWSRLIRLPEKDFEKHLEATLKILEKYSAPEMKAIVSSLKTSQPDNLAAIYKWYAQVTTSGADQAANQTTLTSASATLPTAPKFQLQPFEKDDLAQLLDRNDHRDISQLRQQILDLSNRHPGAPGHAMVVKERSPSYDPKVFVRGDPQRPGRAVPRQSLKILGQDIRKSFEDNSGRLGLAESIMSASNPLTARVFVNRVWMHHFGEPIVESMDNFGVNGLPPTDLALLDLLADTFKSKGWSIKSLHRFLLNSSTFAQSSYPSAATLKNDPINRLHSRQVPRYKDYESTRDSLLAVAGQLDLKLGGRTIPKDKVDESNRRSLYLFVDRMIPRSDQQTFNFPDIKKTISRRATTIVPAQNLFVMNSPLVRHCAKSLHESLATVTSLTVDQKIELIHKKCFCRLPSPGEKEQLLAYLGASGAERAQQIDGSIWTNYIHAMMMTNEFLFID